MGTVGRVIVMHPDLYTEIVNKIREKPGGNKSYPLVFNPLWVHCTHCSRHIDRDCHRQDTGANILFFLAGVRYAVLPD